MFLGGEGNIKPPYCSNDVLTKEIKKRRGFELHFKHLCLNSDHV